MSTQSMKAARDIDFGAVPWDTTVIWNDFLFLSYTVWKRNIFHVSFPCLEKKQFSAIQEWFVRLLADSLFTFFCICQSFWAIGMKRSFLIPAVLPFSQGKWDMVHFMTTPLKQKRLWKLRLALWMSCVRGCLGGWFCSSRVWAMAR